MTLKLEKDAYEFIKKKGGVCTVRLAVAKGCCGAMPLPDIRYSKPKETSGVEALTQDGVSVYVGKGMCFENDLVHITLSGTLFFKSLELPTLRLLEACKR